MLNDLRFSETVYGFGAGIFFLGYFLFEVPSNLMLHKVGARNWLARIMLTWAVISACFIFVKSPTTFYVLRFLLGVAEAGFAPGVILYLTYWFPSARRAKALSLFFMAIPLAGIVGGPLSGSSCMRSRAYTTSRAGSGCSSSKRCRRCSSASRSCSTSTTASLASGSRDRESASCTQRGKRQRPQGRPCVDQVFHRRPSLVVDGCDLLLRGARSVWPDVLAADDHPQIGRS